MPKILSLIILLFLSTNTLFAQQIGLQAGQVFSNLQFKDSQGRELDNLQSTNHFFMTVDYRKNIFSDALQDKVFASVGIGFNGYGATGSDPTLDNFFEWDLAYVGILLGVDYEFYQNGAFKAFAGIKVSPEFLVRGSQVINSQVFDLKGEEDFDAPIIFLRGAIGTQYEVTSEATLYLQYQIGKSYSLSGSDQELNLIAHNFGVGIFLNLQPDKKKTRKR